MTAAAIGALFVALVLAAVIGLTVMADTDRAARTEIMRQLAHGEWRYGLDLVEASQGKLGRGTVYIHLHFLEERGLVESRFEECFGDGLPPRRLYRATGART